MTGSSPDSGHPGTAPDGSRIPDSFDDAQLTSFAVLETLGEGAAGTILLAQESNLQREVALKVLKPHPGGQKHILKRFLREARIIAHLDHPAIVPIYRLTVHEDGRAAYAMKPVRGKTFQELIKEARQQIDAQGRPDKSHDTPALLEHFIKVCDALHFAHVKGVLHRDIKPANIMIGPYNEVYVMDWGIARLDEDREDNSAVVQAPLEYRPDEQERTQVGTLLGTPRYMSPEQAAGQVDRMDARSDLFSLGLVLFELACLRPALRGKTWQELSQRIHNAQLEPLKHYRARQHIPVELRAIIGKATMADPGQRYPDVAAFALDIRRFLRGDAVSVHSDTLPQKIMRWVTHHKQIAFALILSLILLAAAAIGAGLIHRQQLLIRQQQEQLVLGRLLTGGAALAQHIEHRFLHFEALLQRLSGSATQLMTHSRPSGLRYYTSAQNAAGKGAPDLTESAAYNIPISIDWPSIKVAPGADRKQVEPLIQQLAALRPTLQDILRDSMGNPPADTEPFRQRVLQQGAPLVWAYVGIRQGVLIAYPGSGTYPAAYDPRPRPWYRQSMQGGHNRWLAPYVDISGRGLMLPCTQPLRDAQGALLGVAGVELSLQDVRDHLLLPPGSPAGERAYLLDGRGNIIIGSREQLTHEQAGTLINASKQLTPYPDDSIVEQIRAGHSGNRIVGEGREQRLIAFYRLESVGWYYLRESPFPVEGH